jgi:hypothetical protein
MRLCGITSLAISLLVLAGCATRPVTIETAKPIKPNKQAKFSQKTKARNALLSFVRNNGFVGSACESRIMINGERVGEVGTGKIINIYLKPGKHKVNVKPTNINICGGDEIESVVKLTRDSEKHFRVAILQKLDLEPIQRKAPRKDL